MHEKLRRLQRIGPRITVVTQFAAVSFTRSETFLRNAAFRLHRAFRQRQAIHASEQVSFQAFSGLFFRPEKA